MSYINSKAILNKLTEKLATYRAGRVNSSLLDHIMVFVSAYGVSMKVVELATINSPESNQLVITPFDKGHLNLIEQAIIKSNLGVNPVNDGFIVRLVFPPLTEERRKDMAKEVGKEEETFKIEVRQIRQDHMNTWKKQKEAGEISEDQLEKNKSDLQDEVDKINKEIESIIKHKQEELMKL